MFKFNTKLMAGAALTVGLLAGCGGNDGYGGGVAAGGPPPVMQQTISDVFAFINQLIAGNDENSDPIDTNGLTLASDDTTEPTPLN